MGASQVITLDALRGFAVTNSIFPQTSLKRALERMGFVQADPIRAPARAQDLILRHRVKDYRAGELEQRYSKLEVEEDFFVTYGFVTRFIQRLMHPRSDSRVPADNVGQPWPPARAKKAQLLLEFVRERGEVHPREVDDHFSHGKVRNYWGGSSNATTQLLEAMHYRGLLRVSRRERGIRIYTAHEHGPPPANSDERLSRIDQLVDAVVRIYAPLPAASLSDFVRRLRFAVPQWRGELKSALERARERLTCVRIEGVDWYWPADENPLRSAPLETVRLLAPFDPVVRDRARFELLWGWVYRFEAYTPAPKRKLGYYALPLLWRDSVIGWANLSVNNSVNNRELTAEFGYVKSQAPRERLFKRELDAELDRVRVFLSLES